MHLAQNLKYLREQKDLSQRELSDVLGFSSSAVTMWEQGRRSPDIETIIKLAEYFNITLDELVRKDLRPPIPLYATNLRYLRAKYNMTQEDMAYLLGCCGKRGYNAIETGKTNVAAENLKRIGDFFGITPDRLTKQDLTKEDDK